MTSSIPEQWAQAMRKAGVLDARFGNPSMSELGRVAGVHTSTVSTLITKGKLLSPKNMRAIADALGVTVGDITKWATGEVISPYIPPAGAEHLTYRERNAVDEIILTMIEGKAERNDEPDQKKIRPAAEVPGKTPFVRRHLTPMERAYQETHGLAARLNTERTDD